MPHPEIDNQTPLAFEPLFVTDEDGRPVVATIVKGTFAVSEPGSVSLATVQQPVNFGGEFNGEPGESSYRLEPETAFVKPRTDVALLGHAHAPYLGANRVDVEFTVGPLRKIVRVWGDRRVVRSAGAAMSAAEVFERIPLMYERAFGGWDRSPDDPVYHAFEPRNPVGVGFRAKHGKVYEGQLLPNLEDPSDPLESVGGACAPVGFGFLGPDWQPRASFAGTYDDAWERTRSPLLPSDFDRRFFNAASPGLIAAGHLLGDETVFVRNATPEGLWGFQLPRVAHPRCTIATRFDGDLELDTVLDTLVVDADARQFTIIWRQFVPLREGPSDVAAVRIRCPNLKRVSGDAGSTT